MSETPSSDEGKNPIFRKGRLLVDYVAIFGHADESFESKQMKEQLADPTCKLEGAVLARVPETDHPLQPFPPGVSMFVFPSGILMKPTKEKRTFHSFVLTMASGTRMYGYCCTIYEPLDAKKMAIVRMQIAAKLMALPNPNLDDYQLPSQLYVPKAICVLSVYPFIQRTMKLVKQLCARQIHSDEHVSAKLANTFYQLLKCPGPIQGQSPVHLTISRSFTEFSFPPLTQAPLADVDFDILFSRLDPMNLITLLNCVLLELPVLVVSCHADILTPALEALVSLMYPFTWNYIYIPLLPSCLNDVFAAPQSYLIGTLTETLNDPPWPSNAVIVDLDNNDVRVNVHGSHTFAPLPWRLAWRLYASITKHYNLYYERHPQSRINVPKDLPPFCQVLDVAQENSVENLFGASQIPIITLDTANVLASGLDESSEENLSDEDQGSRKSNQQLGEGDSDSPPPLGTPARTISDGGGSSGGRDRKCVFRSGSGGKPPPPSGKRPLSNSHRTKKKGHHPDGNLLMEEDGASPVRVRQRKGQLEDEETEKKRQQDGVKSPSFGGVGVGVSDMTLTDRKNPRTNGTGVPDSLFQESQKDKGVKFVGNLERGRAFSDSSMNIRLRVDYFAKPDLAQNFKKKPQGGEVTESTLKDTLEKGLHTNKDSELNSKKLISNSDVTERQPPAGVSKDAMEEFEAPPSLSRSSSRSSEDSFIELPNDTQQGDADDQSSRLGGYRSKKLLRREKDGSGESAEPEIFELEGVEDGEKAKSAPAIMFLGRGRYSTEADDQFDEPTKGDDDAEADAELEKILGQRKSLPKNSHPSLNSSTPISIPRKSSERSPLRPPRKSGEERKKMRDLMCVRKTFLSVFVSLFKSYDQWIRARDVSVFSRPMRGGRETSSSSISSWKENKSVSSTSKGGSDHELKNVAADVTPLKTDPTREEKEAIRDIGDESPMIAINKKTEDESSDRFFLFRDRVDSTFTRTEFDERGFQSQFESKADKLFMQRIIESQMFNVFIQQRMTRLYVGASPDWFDLSITKTLQRRAANRYKRGRQLKCGILFKQGSVIPNWHARFFVLEGLTLTYYKPTYGEQIASKDRKLRKLLAYERTGKCPPSKLGDLKRQIEQERANLEKLKLSLAKGVVELLPGQTKVGVPDTPGRLYKTCYVFEVVVPSHRLIACSETSRERDGWIEAILARVSKPPSLPNDLAFLYRKSESEILASTLQYLKSRSLSGSRSPGSTLSSPAGSQSDSMDLSGKTPPSSSPRKSFSTTRSTRRTVGSFSKSPSSYSPTGSSPTKVRPEHIRGRFGTVI